MKRYLLLMALLFLGFFVSYHVIQLLGFSFLEDPFGSISKKDGNFLIAFIGVGLLMADLILPVPSSFIMVAHGTFFGVFLGSILSLVGSVGAALIGFKIGQIGGPFANRFISPEDQKPGNEIFAHWGLIAVVITRPIPLLAETVAIMAGTSQISIRSFLIASAAGSIPGSVLFAIAGAYSENIGHSFYVFLAVMCTAGIFWYINQKKKREKPMVGVKTTAP